MFAGIRRSRSLLCPQSGQHVLPHPMPCTELAWFTHDRAGAPPMLCKPRQPDVTDGAAADSATANGSTDAAAGAASDVDQRLPHTYDDADLYEQLLKEFLEGSGAPGSGAALLQRVSEARHFQTAIAVWRTSRTFRLRKDKVMMRICTSGC